MDGWMDGVFTQADHFAGMSALLQISKVEGYWGGYLWHMMGIKDSADTQTT